MPNKADPADYALYHDGLEVRKGKEATITDMNTNHYKRCGYWLTRETSGGPEVPMVIFKNNGVPLALVGVKKRKISGWDNVAEIHLRDAITKEEYDNFMALPEGDPRTHGQKVEPTDVALVTPADAGIGHNEPPEEMTLTDIINDDDKTAKGKFETIADLWLADDREINDSNARDLNDFMDQITAFSKRLVAKHKDEKAPHLEAGRAVDAKYKPLIEALQSMKGKLNGKLTKWMRNKEQIETERLRKIAEKEREEQEEKTRREFQERLAEQGVSPEDANKMAQAEIDKQPPPVETAPPPTRVVASRFGGSGRGLITVWRAMIKDREAALIALKDNPKVIEAAQKALDKIATDNKGSARMPGVVFYEDRVAR